MITLNKHPNNPIIPGVPCGTAACRADQFYPSSVYKNPQDGKFYAWSKSNGNTWCAYSDDGLTNWQYLTQPTTIKQDSFRGTKNESNVNRFDPSSGIHFMFYGNNQGANPNFTKCVFLAHGYTVNHTHPPNNVFETYQVPVIGLHNTPRGPKGELFTWFDPGDFKILPDGSGLLYTSMYNPEIYVQESYIGVYKCKPNNWHSFAFDKFLFSSSHLRDNNLHWGGPKVLQKPTLFRHGGKYVILFNFGHYSVLPKQRSIYAGIGDDPYRFKIYKHPVIESSPEPSFDSLRVYNPEVAVIQDGEYWTPEPMTGNIGLYYSTLDVPHSNYGQTSYAEITSIDFNQPESDFFDSDFITLNNM